MQAKTKRASKKSNVVIGPFNTRLDIPVERIRKVAQKNCERLLCIGLTKEGKPYYSSSFADATEMLWMIERFKLNLLKDAE